MFAAVVITHHGKRRQNILLRWTDSEKLARGKGGKHGRRCRSHGFTKSCHCAYNHKAISILPIMDDQGVGLIFIQGPPML